MAVLDPLLHHMLIVGIGREQVCQALQVTVRCVNG